MKIVCVGYRVWALNIYKKLKKNLDHDFLIINHKNNFNEEKIYKLQPDIILFYGWSWNVSSKLTDNFSCLMLHPSDLPKFRGGSPIQNQIIQGVNNSKITIFLMTQELDGGDIVAQKNLDLSGTIKDIFLRLEKDGLELTSKIINQGIIKTPQSKKNISCYKRRSQSESEITIKELLEKDSNYLYNKIRMLGDPYPNAYIKTSDNKKLLIKLAEIQN